MTRRATLMILTLMFALTAVGCDELPLPPGTVLPFGDKTSPYYWGDLFLDIYADELVVGELEPGPGTLEEPRVVLLITGVTIPERWFDPIVARLERDGFTPVVYEPPALLSGSLFEATDDLAEVVEQLRAETGQDKIDILAECTAGVVSRHYIQSQGGDAYVSRLVTFVSPHHGIDKAPLAAFIAGWPALYDLTPGSDFLTAVNSAPLPESVPVTSIYTCSDEYIQPWEGSIVPGATNIGLCDGTVGHFQTFYDPAIYAIMHDALTEPLPTDEDEVVEDAPIEDAPNEEERSGGGQDGTGADVVEAELDDEPTGEIDQESAWEEDPSEDANGEGGAVNLNQDWTLANAGAADDAEEGGAIDLRHIEGGCSAVAPSGGGAPPASLWVVALMGLAVFAGRRRG